MYGKIFETMYEGSMVGAGATVFAVWGYCIAKADPDTHEVRLNPIILSTAIGEDKESIESAIEYLTRPDPDSTNEDHEGRRLLHVAGMTYLVVSHAHYRGIKTSQDKRDYERDRKRRYRAKTNDESELSHSCPKCPGHDGTPASASVSVSVSDKKREDDGKKKNEITLPFESQEFKDAWKDFKEHRRKLRKPMTTRAEIGQLKKLDGLDEKTAIKWIDTAIVKGWQGIYEPDSNGSIRTGSNLPSTYHAKVRDETMHQEF